MSVQDKGGMILSHRLKFGFDTLVLLSRPLYIFPFVLDVTKRKAHIFSFARYYAAVNIFAEPTYSSNLPPIAKSAKLLR